MGFWLVIVGVAIFFVVKAARNSGRRVREAWGAAASQLGLQFDPGSLTRRKSLNGFLQGKRIEVETFTRNSGSKSSHAMTRYRVHHPERLVSGLQIKPRGLLSGAAAFLGAQDIRTGDAEFDARVVVKGDSPNRVAGYLTPERRRAVLRLLDEFKGVKIDDQNIEWSKTGVSKNAGEIVEIVNQLSSAATTLAGSANVADVADVADVAGLAGLANVADSASALEKVAVPMTAAAAAAVILDAARGKPISVDAPAELRALQQALTSRPGTEPAATPTPAAASTAAPSAEPSVKPSAEPAATPTAAPVAPADGLAVAAVCAQLFTRSITSTEAKRRFEENYKGKRVRWSGNLRRAATFSVDIVFKGGPGTKATFALPVPSEGALGGAVQAVVQLAPAAAEQLRSRVGEEIAFEGRLLSCDTLVRTFNIADATVH